MASLQSLLSLCLLYSVLPQNVAAISTTVISGTTITMSANPHGIPTLAYNCAKLPSICNNVNGNGGQYQLTDLGNGLKGRLSTVNFVTLYGKLS
ncbi:hypothetical protein M433DRAFT_430112 [Acidomyces richmondensis BFW]|nr:MAG: hypothetical protein FE78DRAFT_235544 [Acidomyces sp. 'richmondensis']KYG48310.1 hypothetical protein M433DRAFT_430112 [Acidomyces richmondensis BFW]